MHAFAFKSLALFLLSGKGALTASAPPPNGYVAFYSIFDHLGCDSYSRGLTTVPESKANQCLNFTYPSTSVDLEQLKEGCSGKFVMKGVFMQFVELLY
jgi:hypothetical protein